MINKITLALSFSVLASGCALTPETQNVLIKTCSTGETFYSYIRLAAATETISPALKAKADQTYAVLKPLCDKGANATQADIVLAGAQVYALTKLWRDAT